MSECIKIDISGINLEIIHILQSQYNKNLKIVDKKHGNKVQLQIPQTIHDESMLIALNDFLDNLKSNRIHELVPSWIFDENNAVIIGPDRKFYLTPKEVLFIKMLLKNDKIVTYDYMMDILWNGRADVSSNAMRVFIKNIKKKLPAKILKNFQDIGYKLDL